MLSIKEAQCISPFDIVRSTTRHATLRCIDRSHSIQTKRKGRYIHLAKEKFDVEVDPKALRINKRNVIRREQRDERQIPVPQELEEKEKKSDAKRRKVMPIDEEGVDES